MSNGHISDAVQIVNSKLLRCIRLKRQISVYESIVILFSMHHKNDSNNTFLCSSSLTCTSESFIATAME